MRRVTGSGDDRRLYYSTNNDNNNDNKIIILSYFLFNIPLPNDIITKTIYLHLPNGRTASPFYPPLLPTVSGWLLCESSSNGGCLMPNAVLSYYCSVNCFLFHIPLPVTKRIDLHLPHTYRRICCHAWQFHPLPTFLIVVCLLLYCCCNYCYC
jgi:hypothetical protein